MEKCRKRTNIIYVVGEDERMEIKMNDCSYKIINDLHRLFWEVERVLYKRKETVPSLSEQISQVTYYAVRNAGDTVLSQCVRKGFDFENTDKKTGWNIIEVNKPVTTKTIDSVNRTKFLVIGGGGLFLPDTNKNIISGWQWAISKEQLEEIQPPIFVFSVGYNYFKGQKVSDLFKENLEFLCRKAKFFGLRNKGSIEAVQALLPSELRSKVVYQPCMTTLIRLLYKDSIPAKKKTNRVVFNLAFDRAQMRYGNNKQAICRAVAKAAKEIEMMGYKITLVYHCKGDSEIHRYMDAENVTYDVKNLVYSFPKEVYEFYNEIACVIGMRGHAQMIPFGLNCGIISLGTHDKMKWFLEDIDAEDWYVDLNEDLNTLSNRIVTIFRKNMIENLVITETRLLAAQEKLWEITQANMKAINSIVENKQAAGMKRVYCENS